ncbi:hypothetical protein [Catellatospora sichuanensis]|uniref:hypothetical protein n=1 Tax=Catellatospora sichuanensis TaxID=1969805 RepID=UPI00118357A5|nr:hypothetical protein [Catellatospora sichuanensis]
MRPPDEPVATEPQVRVVLDLTALTAYARLTGMGVAELIAMVEEDDGISLVGVPAGQFVAAHWQLDTDERQRLIGMVSRPEAVTVILPLLGADAVEAVEIGHDMGHAVIEARRRGALLATYDGGQARRHLADDVVLDLLDK